jgi:hypothetical protein
MKEETSFLLLQQQESALVVLISAFPYRLQLVMLLLLPV